jgi:predicted dienelactone hydrolase
MADEAVQETLTDCLSKIFAIAAVQHPKSRSGAAVRASLKAVRARLEWQEERTAR